MVSRDHELRQELRDALSDGSAAQARAAAAESLSAAMRDAGQALWHAGYFIGSDRVDETTPFGFGSDLTVGVATAFQVGGELVSGSVSLLEAGNRYAAMALLRQIVEVEYLGWAFAEDADRTGAVWLRSTRSERRKMWEPRSLRSAAGERFRGQDYGSHCELGGHPTPASKELLPDHSNQISEAWIWFELCHHGGSAWDYLVTAVADAPHAAVLNDLASAKTFARAWKAWDATDPLVKLVDEIDELVAAEERKR